MTPRPTVRDLMATDLIVLQADLDILHALKLLLDHKISGAPVVEATGTMVGVLAKKDCMRAALNAAYFPEWGSPVSGFMNTRVATLEADMDLITASERFLASHFRRFPVLQAGRLVGQISRADILRALVETRR